MMRALAVVVCFGSLSACWPGRCEGGLRAILPLPPEGQTTGELARTVASLSINLDTNLQNGSEILAASQLSERSVLLEGPTGMVPLSIEASVTSSAHSCASRGTLSASPRAALTPGTYTFIVLMDQVKWPAISRGDVTSWQGHPAMVRRYRVL